MAPTIEWREFQRPDAALLAQAAAARTPDLANALGGAVVADPALRPIWRGARVLGPALTVKLTGGDNLGAIHAALNARPGDVLVIETDPPATEAIAGTLLSRGARLHGVAGIVVDGAVRDVAELEEMRFPVWSRLVCPRQASKNRDAVIGGPVRCGGCVVSGGDIVAADDDGVVFVAPAALALALDAIRGGIANERRLADDGALEQTLQAIAARAEVLRR